MATEHEKQQARELMEVRLRLKEALAYAERQGAGWFYGRGAGMGLVVIRPPNPRWNDYGKRVGNSQFQVASFNPWTPHKSRILGEWKDTTWAEQVEIAANFGAEPQKISDGFKRIASADEEADKIINPQRRLF